MYTELYKLAWHQIYTKLHTSSLNWFAFYESKLHTSSQNWFAFYESKLHTSSQNCGLHFMSLIISHLSRKVILKNDIQIVCLPER